MAKKKASSESNTSKKSTTKAKAKTTRGGNKSTPTKKKAAPKKRPATKSRTSPSKSKSSNKYASDNFKLNRIQKALIAGVALFVLAFLFLLSLISPNQGALLSSLSGFIKQLFGWGSYVIAILTALTGFYLVQVGMDQAPKIPTMRVIGFTLLFVAFEALASMYALAREIYIFDIWEVARAGLGGGYFGSMFAWAGITFVGTLGSTAIFLALGLVAVILFTGVTVEDFQGLLDGMRNIEVDFGNEPDDVLDYEEIPISGLGGSRTLTREKRVPDPVYEEEVFDVDVAPEKPKKVKAKKVPIDALVSKKAPEKRAPAEKPALPTINRPIKKSVAKDSKPIVAAAEGQWQLPTLNGMLEVGKDTDLSNNSIREHVETIEHTLESFGAPARVVEISQGPTVTQYGVEPMYIEMRNGKRTKVKVGKIAGLSDDLALALSADSVRIQAPVPGKGYVGIEVPNPNKAVVSLRDVMESPDFDKMKKSPLRIGLGQNVSGQPTAADLAKMPHLLVAGATGSGKSVCVNSIIACLLINNTPDDLRLVMVDPKRVELTGYNGIPHLVAPVVVDMDRVIGTLQWALKEMDNRYKTFARNGARNITDYNKIAKKKKEPKLPYIVIIIDELADLMMLAPDETERSIARLAQMARATGMHMILATQRPSVDVVTGLIKANFPARIAFAVSSGTDSRVILDATGAERLLGQGDMLFQNPNAPTPERMQGCFVSDGELSSIITYWKTARRFSHVSLEEAKIPKAELVPIQPPAQQPMTKPTPPAPVTQADPAPTPVEPSEQRVTQPNKPTPVTMVPKPKPRVKSESDALIPETLTPEQLTPEPEAHPDLEQQPLWEEMVATAKSENKYDDEIMEEAIAMVRDLQKASTSLLQRRFRIGYTRAARLIDQMEDDGIIGPPTGTSKAREVYLPKETDDTAEEEPTEQHDV